MDSSDISARLRFLNDASHLLAATAPTTSRYLMLRCNSLFFDNDIVQTNSGRRKTCGACGSIAIVGWEASIDLERKRKKRSKDISKALVYKCEVCNMETRFALDPAPKTTNRPGTSSKSMSQIKAHNPIESSDTVPGPKTAKKRSKSAKQGGLKALLQKKKESAATASGFDLMDFMKRA